MGEGVGNGGPVAITLCTIDGDRPTWRAIARMVNPDACSARIIALRSPLAHAANHRTPQTLSAVVHRVSTRLSTRAKGDLTRDFPTRFAARHAKTVATQSGG